MKVNGLILVMVIVTLMVGVGTSVADLMHGDTSGNNTYIDLTDNGVSDGEWAQNITTFEVFEPLPHAVGETQSVLKTSATGVSYFDASTGQTTTPIWNIAMLTMDDGDVTSWMETKYDDHKDYLLGRIWGTSDMDGVVPDFALLAEDTNEDGVYAYYGSVSGTLYTGLFGDAVFESFFVNDSPAELDDFFPAYDYDASGLIIVDDFAYGLPEPATMTLLGLGGLALLRRKRW